MGGTIAVIKKVDNKIQNYLGGTNSFSSVVRHKEFYTDPNNSFLKEYLQFADKWELNSPDDYGVIIIDYDNKHFYTINGYSSYLNILSSEISLMEIQEGDSRSADLYNLFDDNILVMRKTRSVKIDEYNNERTHEYIPLSDIKDFKSINDVSIWLNGKKSLMGLRQRRGGNDIIEVSENEYILHELFIDVEKLGWKYFNYEESHEGYLELFKELTYNGWSFSHDDINQWCAFVDEIYGEDCFDEETEEEILFNESISNFLINNRNEKIEHILK